MQQDHALTHHGIEETIRCRYCCTQLYSRNHQNCTAVEEKTSFSTVFVFLSVHSDFRHLACT